MGADHCVRRSVQRLTELLQHGRRVEQRPIRHHDLHIGNGVERTGDSVVLVPGDDHPAARLYQRADGNIQPMGGTGREHHLGRIVHVEQLRRRHPAPQIRFLRPPGGGIAAPARRGQGVYRLVHGPPHRIRLLERSRSRVKIDHSSTSLYPSSQR